jgi:type VI secretion system protein ImpM
MAVGFFGKLPSHGDFLRRRVSEGFVDGWDGWLRACLAESRSALGAEWLDIYLTSPAWRFVCGAGACGSTPVIGLLAPSVDRVGRYFPITLVAELPQESSLVSVAALSGRFFEAAERLIIETLAAEHVDFDRFDAGVVALDEEFALVLASPGLVLDQAASAVLTDATQSWQVPIGASSRLPTAFEQLLSLQLEAQYRPLVLLWTDGSTAVEPSCLLLKGLPDPAQYTALLRGAWTEHGWRPVPARVAEESVVFAVGAENEESLFFRSAGVTDMGKARANNEDGFVERPEAGLWAVADGMGGHSHGEVASRMVCDALADFQPDGTFEDAVNGAALRVVHVNDYLLNAGSGSAPADQSGSTVVVLMLRGARGAVLWAGDSRVYRWRRGRLEQLTRDHSLAELVGPAAANSSVITRAVGVQANLTLDIRREFVREGDRFLLCSDGLTRVIPDEQICELMGTADVKGAVDGLIKATLDGGAPDNATVVIVEATR